MKLKVIQTTFFKQSTDDSFKLLPQYKVNANAGRVEFMAKFPQSGKYKLWGQFNRNGKIVVAGFWVNVL